jgi:hypothetical protein
MGDATDATFTTAKVKAIIDPQEQGATFRFQYISDAQFQENLGNSLPGFEGAATGIEEFIETAETVERQLTGLASATTYHLRIQAENADGQTEAVAASTLTTETATVPTLVVGPASEVGYTTAHLTGSVDPEGGNEEAGSPLPLHWEWQITLDQVEGGWVPAAEGTIEGPDAQLSAAIAVPVDLEDLQSASEYEFRLVVSYAGRSEVSSEGTFTTLTVAPPSVEAGDTTAITGTTAHFQGKVTAGEVDAGFKSECAFDYLTDAAYQNHLEVQAITIKATEGTFALSYKGEETTSLAVNASTAEVQSALQALPQIGVGGIAVGPGPGGPKVTTSYTLTFPTPVNVNEVGVDGNLLSASPGTVNFSEYISIQTVVEGHPKGFDGAQTIACGPTNPVTGISPTTVEADPAGLLPHTVYHLRLRAENQGGSSLDVAGNFETNAIAPTARTLFASQLTAHSAVLAAKVNPHNSSVTYQFAWGIDEDYGSFTPVTPTPLGASDNSLHVVTAQIAGLEEGITYHFRILATNTETTETAESEDHIFTTPSGSETSSCPNEQRREEANSLALPDCRGLELVMPAVKDFPFGQANSEIAIAAAAGGAIAYQSFGPLPGSSAGSQENFNLSRRGADGWSNTPLAAPQTTTPGRPNYPETQGFSDDLSFMAFKSENPPLTADAAPDVTNLYSRDIETGANTLLSTVPGSPGASPFLFFGGASDDFGHVAFEGIDPLLPGAPPVFTQGLYEWANGEIRFVGIYPDGTPAPLAYLGSGASSFNRVNHAVSDDGRRIVWSDGSKLYDRIDGTDTVELSASQRAILDPAGSQAVFWGASADGGKVFFTSEAALTDEAVPGAGKDLYEYDFESSGLTDLSLASTPSDQKAEVEGVVGNSDDGEYVYFVARGDLGGNAEAGALNLYLSHHGQARYIGALDPADEAAWGATFSSTSQQAGVTSRVAADGSLAIQSVASLTGYDNANPSTGAPTSQVYLYSPNSGELTCVSCRPDGSPPSGSSTITPPDFVTNTPRNLSDDGSRLFFNSTDAIVPADTNGKSDVYEWTNGATHLISDGTSNFGAFFQDASADGDDVYFSTGARLVGQDTDEHVDLYDARVGGGFPKPSLAPVPCNGEGCRGEGSAAPGAVTAATPSFLGRGNRPIHKGKSGKRGKGRKACSRRHDKHHHRKCKSHSKKRSSNKSGRGK